MSDDLKSCPFCGSYDLGSGGDDKVVGYWCKRCEATGPNQYGRYEWNSRADRIEELEAKLEACKKYRDAYAECDRISTHALRKAVEAGVDVAASLNAAISLLERGGKKAAPSDKMFNQMLVDYKTSLDRFRTTLAELKGETDG